MQLARTFSGKKFMWDGRVYKDGREAEESGQKYRGDGFEVQLIEEGREYFLFTRRLVKEIVVEGKPI